MNRISAPLLGVIAVCLIGLGVACGGGSTTADIGNGPAVNVNGIWEGAYTGQDAAHSGTFCADFQQNNRQISGSVAFDGGQATAISGLVVEDRISFVWGALASATTAVGSGISAGGGTFSGNVSAGTASGGFTMTSTAATGAWTGHTSDKRSCSG
jgi:hypothetical protein